MSELEKATNVVEKVVGTAEKIAKIAKEAGLGNPKKRVPEPQAPPAGDRSEARRQKKLTQRRAAPMKVAARQYAWRAILYALLLTLGGLFLFMWAIKADANIAFLLPTIIGVVFLVFLACGFKLAYESLRPRPLKNEKARIATNYEEMTNATPSSVESSIPLEGKPSEKAVRSLAKVIRRYCIMRGIPDSEIERYAYAVLAGEKQIDTLNADLAFYTPILHTLSRALALSTPAIKNQAIVLTVDAEKPYRKHCDDIIDWLIHDLGYIKWVRYFAGEEFTKYKLPKWAPDDAKSTLQWLYDIGLPKVKGEPPRNVDRVLVYEKPDEKDKDGKIIKKYNGQKFARFFEAEENNFVDGLDQMIDFMGGQCTDSEKTHKSGEAFSLCEEKKIIIEGVYLVYDQGTYPKGDPHAIDPGNPDNHQLTDVPEGPHAWKNLRTKPGNKPIFLWSQKVYNAEKEHRQPVQRQIPHIYRENGA